MRSVLVRYRAGQRTQSHHPVRVSAGLTGVVESDVAMADGAVEYGLLRRDAGRHHRPAVRHVMVAGL